METQAEVGCSRSPGGSRAQTSIPDHYSLMEEPPFTSENGAIGMPVHTMDSCNARPLYKAL